MRGWAGWPGRERPLEPRERPLGSVGPGRCLAARSCPGCGAHPAPPHGVGSPRVRGRGSAVSPVLASRARSHRTRVWSLLALCPSWAAPGTGGTRAPFHACVTSKTSAGCAHRVPYPSTGSIGLPVLLRFRPAHGLG